MLFHSRFFRNVAAVFFLLAASCSGGEIGAPMEDAGKCHPRPGGNDCQTGDTCDCRLTNRTFASYWNMTAAGIKNACAPEKSFCRVNDDSEPLTVDIECGWDLEEGQRFLRPSEKFLDMLWDGTWSFRDAIGSAFAELDENGYVIWRISVVTVGGVSYYDGCVVTYTDDGYHECFFNRKNKLVARSAIIRFRADGTEAWMQVYEAGDVPLGQPAHLIRHLND